ncbi:MAG: glutamate-cysteine ligase family protein [bacterium]|nr:glutamate-cysteine ligase family protein [bacterium]
MIQKPFTFGYEWEIPILTTDLMLVKDKDVDDIAHKLRNKFPWSRTGYDWMARSSKMLEIKSGILNSYNELREKTSLQMEELKNLCKEKGVVFFPIGAHPLIGGACGLHVHIGSIYNIKELTLIANSSVRYLPCFAALAANSPVWEFEAKEYKSYRVKKFANWASNARIIPKPNFGEIDFASDACVSMIRSGHPTVELRIGDSPSSVQFAIEYVGFVVAFFLGLIKNKCTNLTHQAYVESIENRWRASKFGLQAVFLWDGEKIGVTDILKKMLEIADFESLGTDKPNLIKRMLKLRQTQADWQLLIHKYNNDTHSFAKSINNEIMRGDILKDYLSKATELPPEKCLSVENCILENIGMETRYLELYELLQLPHQVMQQKLKNLEKSGHIKIQKNPEKGIVYSRVLHS